MNLEDALQTYLVECRELLEDMEISLLAIQQAEEKVDLLNTIFRAAHTIKGSAGLFGLEPIVDFTHVVESVLDRIRAGELEIKDQMVVLLLTCADHISALVNAVANGSSLTDFELVKKGEPLIAQLGFHLEMPRAAVMLVKPDVDSNKRIDGIAALVARGGHWFISLRFGSDVLKNGMDPLSFLRYLATIGSIIDIATMTRALPTAELMNPEACYLGVEIVYDSNADIATIEGVFEFVQDDCQLSIIAPYSPISDFIALMLQQQPIDADLLGAMLVRCGTLTAHELDAALKVHCGPITTQTDAALVERELAHVDAIDSVLSRQNIVKESVAAAPQSRTIRVSADKLDQLIDLVGELIIAGASVNLAARQTHNRDLHNSTSKLSLLVEEVRDSALQLRMVKIGATFSRFQRVVHDVSLDLGKDIALIISGEDTELDKAVVEKIGDPLMHLVRNSIDHGIESAELRAARGKPAHGTLKLSAFHDSGTIVITVKDDGGGLKRELIQARAVERGLIEIGHTLSDVEIYDLIFEPGFSTAEKVSNLSGRGVGMDVVKRNITALGGTVEIASEESVSTTVTVRLPLTLAIIDGFLIEVGQSIYAIPLDMIEECIAYTAELEQDYTNLRGQVLPFIRLRELFSIPGTPERRQNIVVIKYAGQKVGLVVDRLLGEFQTVIKPLARMFKQVKCISGSTILGSGEVALILDVPVLMRQATPYQRITKA